MRPPNVHLTLAFLGEVDLERLDALRALASGVTCPRFVMTVNRLGWWHHNRVAWAGVEAPPELADLVARLREALRRADFPCDDGRAYVPHVTLLRNARCDRAEMPPLPPIHWAADEFVLVRSTRGEAGAAYEALGRWALLEATGR